MKKQQKSIPIHELSEPLHQIYYLIGKRPLHKLIPSGFYGAPGFAENGTFVRDDEGKHVSVTLGAGYDFYYKVWTCHMTITDADDLIYTYHKPFTLKEWEKALKIYNDMYLFDPALLDEDFF